MVQTREEKNAKQKIYYEANKDKKAAYNKAWGEANKDKKAAYDKAWREANKDKKAAYDKIREQTPAGKKSNTISDWKRSGLIHDNYHKLYESYLQSTHCDVCKNEYKDTFDRCMDHDHETGLYRQFLCRSCNSNDKWKTLI